jgi:hypothetical protein
VSGYSTEMVLEIENEVQPSGIVLCNLGINELSNQILNLTCDVSDKNDKETVITWLIDVLDSLCRRSRNMLRGREMLQVRYRSFTVGSD